jgi:hypothetical protein
MEHNFQIGKKNKTKLFTEYKIQTQRVLLIIDSILQNAKELKHARLSWHLGFENYRPRKLRQ